MDRPPRTRSRGPAASIGAGIAVAALVSTIAFAQPRPAASATTRATMNPARSPLAEGRAALEREIAARMMRRADLPPAQRDRLELEIDLRILERSLLTAAADARFDSTEQVVASLRARQLHDAAASAEAALAELGAPPTPSQLDAATRLHKLSFSPAGASDEFCRSVALAIVNTASPKPIPATSLPVMRPKPLPSAAATDDHSATVAELTDEVYRLAAISGPLRKQLLGLASAAGNDRNDPALTNLLRQSVDLARGLQSNTAVSPDARLAIETQLAEGIVLFTDPRTRDAGKSHLDALNRYRQTLARIGKMDLSKEHASQLAPAFTWAQANPQAGPKVLATIEAYLDVCAEFDALPANLVPLPAPLRRPAEDVRAQFARSRAAFLQEASRLAPPGANPASLYALLDESRRLESLADDLMAMPPSLDTLGAYKLRPGGALEKRVATAAQAAAAPGANRAEGQKFLAAVHALAELSRSLTSRSFADVPPPVPGAWAGGKLDPFNERWKALVYDLGNSLAAGATELAPAKVARLRTAIALGDALRTAARLEAAVPQAAVLTRWADWSLDPATLHAVLSPYRDATRSAFLDFATDGADALEKWQTLRARYQPLITLILRDAAYAEQCRDLPTGVLAAAARLATPFENAPFATERYASYAVALWARAQQTGDTALADRLTTSLARHLPADPKPNP